MKKEKIEPDIAEILLKIQQQLTFLDKKIDALVARPPEKTFSPEAPRPFRHFDRPSYSQGDRRPDNNYRDRPMHKAVCAECSKECQVPFRPTQDRPVYCKDCFSNRKSDSPFRGSRDDAPREERPFRRSRSDSPRGGAKKKFFDKKRPVFKRRKPRD